ncbi:hypothetical protein [[Actinomadura] parvosata]|uniref:hypothetical protein n=1 Tax=[Actinomadura] parvosata TaxID=1955412 RepID=UPI0012BD1130|nr:hypothetical protein [Nonomuraea sp. ATCC 55076]
MIRRLVVQAVGRRRRGAFDDLAAALLAAVHDHDPAGPILDALAAEPAVWPDLDVAVRHLDSRLTFLTPSTRAWPRWAALTRALSSDGCSAAAAALRARRAPRARQTPSARRPLWTRRAPSARRAP